MQSSDDKSHHKLSATSSIGEDDGSVCDSDMGDDHDSVNDGRMRSLSGQLSSGRSSQNKRYRTNLTNMQIHVMKYMFRDYKTPTMAECEILGSFIGLQKRVVQVWFQNARAKEKKNKLVPSNCSDSDPLITECQRCGVVYSTNCSIQEHIFSARHINQLRSTFNGKLTDCDRDAMRKQAEVRTGVSAGTSNLADASLWVIGFYEPPSLPSHCLHACLSATRLFACNPGLLGLVEDVLRSSDWISNLTFILLFLGNYVACECVVTRQQMLVCLLITLQWLLCCGGSGTIIRISVSHWTLLTCIHPIMVEFSVLPIVFVPVLLTESICFGVSCYKIQCAVVYL